MQQHRPPPGRHQPPAAPYTPTSRVRFHCQDRTQVAGLERTTWMPSLETHRAHRPQVLGVAPSCRRDMELPCEWGWVSADSGAAVPALVGDLTEPLTPLSPLGLPAPAPATPCPLWGPPHLLFSPFPSSSPSSNVASSERPAWPPPSPSRSLPVPGVPVSVPPWCPSPSSVSSPRAGPRLGH